MASPRSRVERYVHFIIIFGLFFYFRGSAGEACWKTLVSMVIYRIQKATQTMTLRQPTCWNQKKLFESEVGDSDFREFE